MQSDMRRFLVGGSSSAKRVREEVDLDSLDAVKKYLDAEGIEYDVSAPLSYLQARVHARMLRKLSPAEREARWKKHRAIDRSRTLGAMKNAVDAFADDYVNGVSHKEKLFTSARCVIENLPDEQVVKCKHHFDWQRCRGNIVRGQCRQCRAFTPGELGYAFPVLIRDEKHENVLYANVSDKGGTALFGMSAVQFNALTHAEKRKQLQRLTGASAFVKVIVAYKPGDELFLNTIYDMFLSDL
jgi:predicted DCC family thiol-disulfide oxidoreductase YuxK